MSELYRFNCADIDVIAFDADDTIWHNEEFFRESEKSIISAMVGFKVSDKSSDELMDSLSKLIVDNLELYGYGIKSFILSTVEFATIEGGDRISGDQIQELISYGRNQLIYPVTPIDNVKSVLNKLKKSYRLIVLTKGDLLEQTQKMQRSGLRDYFDIVEVMHEKVESTYSEVFYKLNIDPKRLIMVGNSFKSDILPPLSVGAKAIYIPSKTVWNHEIVDEIEHKNLVKVDSVEQILPLIECRKNVY